MSGPIGQLRFGLQLAISGGTSARLRAALTALGVGLGVVLLLGAAAVPHIVDVRGAREDARTPVYGSAAAKGLRWLQTNTEFRGDQIAGVTVQPSGPRSPLPPGLSRLPPPGQMIVSPALAQLLRALGAQELERRLDAGVAGTISDAGLTGPRELLFYRGSSQLAARGVLGDVVAFGAAHPQNRAVPALKLLIVMMIVGLLLPVGVFVATASRFGSEDRDRRLAALRLLGADRLATARIAAGESLFGALAGLILGALLFLALRPLTGHISIAGIDVFSADVQPVPALAALVVVLVPACAVLATLIGMRRVAVEPLGVSRRGDAAGRRLTWRLIAPGLGFLVLATFLGHGHSVDSTEGQLEAAAGVVLVLVGVSTLLPWVVESVVRRAPDGPLPYLLAIRRLRGDDGTTGRVVGAIGLAVAGAIALQMLFGAAQDASRIPAGLAAAVDRSTLITAHLPSTDGGTAAGERLRTAAGVSGVIAVAQIAPADGALVAVVSCAAVAQLSQDPGRCRDGDSFLTDGATLNAGRLIEPAPGIRVRVPAGSRDLTLGPGGAELLTARLLLTPAAAARQHLEATGLVALAIVRPGASIDPLRDAAAALDPLAEVSELNSATTSNLLVTLRHILFAGAFVVLLMIGASLLVAAGEQMRERRSLLSVLAAFGMRRSTMAWSMLWQAAVPVALGLVLAIVLGTSLGAVLMKIVSLPITFDWGAIALTVAAGAVVVAAVTAATVPMLWQTMGSDGLREE